MTAIQVRYDELVELLRADFQARYEPNFAWKSAISAFTATTAQRGMWAMSAIDSNGGVRDFSNAGRLTTNNNTVLHNYDGLVPYAEFDGTNWHSVADVAGLDITGTETYIDSSVRGLTMGGWFYFDGAAAALEAVAAKWGAVGNDSYALRRTAGGLAQFQISDDGTATDTVTSGTDTLSATTWYFLAGRFDPSTELAVFINDTKYTNTSSIPASIFDSSAAFVIGAQGGGSDPMDGRASMVFLNAAMLSDSIINQLYYQTKAMFGV